MAPTLIFEKNQLLGVIGSPGGSRIICYVAKTIYEILYLNKNPKTVFKTLTEQLD